MVATFKTNRDITLDKHDFSKRQWRKLCVALGADERDDILWIEIPDGAVELVCRPTKREVEDWKFAQMRKEKQNGLDEIEV